MPGAANRVPIEEAFGERSAVVRARGADRAVVGPQPDEQHGIAVGVTEQRAARLEAIGFDSLAEIGTS